VLTAHGHRVSVLTDTDPTGPGSTDPAPELVRADLRDARAVARAVAGADGPAGGWDGVVHLAALTSARESYGEALRYHAVNVVGTLNLLTALERSGRPEGQRRSLRLVLASSAAVYAGGEGALGEDAPVDPPSPYGASKLAAEWLVAAQARTGGLDPVVLRCFNVTGAVDGYGDPDPTRAVPRLLAVAAGEQPHLTVNGDGTTVRDYTHVLDVAEAFRLALEAPPAHPSGPVGRTYNVGTGEGAALTELVEAARAVTGRPIPLRHAPAAAEAQRLTADSTRLRAELGWAPRHSALEEILRDAWAARTDRVHRGD
jgi:UDP-glucose 4-epimerase